MYKPLRLYLLILMETIKCLSHDESKEPRVNPSILHIRLCRWSLAFSTTLSTSFLSSSGTFKEACGGVQLHKM